MFEYFQVSKAADDKNNYEAKCLIEYDRAIWAKERGLRCPCSGWSPGLALPSTMCCIALSKENKPNNSPVCYSIKVMIAISPLSRYSGFERGMGSAA